MLFNLMFSIFNSNSKKRIGFEDIKIIITNPTKYILINTLNIGEQDILIKNTIHYNQEENLINTLINNYNIPDKPIIIYGRNCCDDNIEKKYDQLTKLGLKEIFIYYGGLFEWLLLNELYGNEEFQLNREHTNIDLLKYRPINIF
jgi:hypothetical protein